VILSWLCAIQPASSFAQPQPTQGQQWHAGSTENNSTIELTALPSGAKPPSSSVPASGQVLLDRSDSIDQLLTHLALTKIPKEYVNTRKWGNQTERWDGIRFEMDQGRLETRRRKKMVNDGTWTKYVASLRNPEEEFQVQVRNVRQVSAGKLGFEIHVAAHIDFKAQQVSWKKGVKLMSLSAHGHAQVNARVDMEVVIATDGETFPPDLIISPHAISSKLEFIDFRIDRVGKVGGEFAQQIGYETKARLSESLPEYESKIVDKINAEFSKKASGYRFSFSELRKSKWSRSLLGLLDTR
jgi:hypothetical protein